MSASSMAPTQPLHEVEARDVFLALMWALSYPGAVQALPGFTQTHESLAAVGRALLDLESSFYAGDEALERRLRPTGARNKPVASASYVFFSELANDELPLLEQASVGDFEYPDNSATLIIGCDFDTPASTELNLSGPGIQSERQIRVANLPAAFWQVRERLIHYPLGVDVFLVSGGQVIGLPRTTKVQPCM